MIQALLILFGGFRLGIEHCECLGNGSRSNSSDARAGDGSFDRVPKGLGVSGGARFLPVHECKGITHIGLSCSTFWMSSWDQESGSDATAQSPEPEVDLSIVSPNAWEFPEDLQNDVQSEEDGTSGSKNIILSCVIGSICWVMPSGTEPRSSRRCPASHSSSRMCTWSSQQDTRGGQQIAASNKYGNRWN